MNRQNDDIICFCEEVTVQDIHNAIKDGATTVEQLTEVTGAGLACGTCIEDLEEILNELLE